MELKERNNLVRETISFPVKYDHLQQTIWDSKGMIVCDFRGWGRARFMNKSEVRQDEVGEKIAKLLNETGADRDKNDDEEQNETNAIASSKKRSTFRVD